MSAPVEEPEPQVESAPTEEPAPVKKVIKKKGANV
jgi:hypothetical protein